MKNIPENMLKNEWNLCSYDVIKRYLVPQDTTRLNDDIWLFDSLKANWVLSCLYHFQFSIFHPQTQQQHSKYSHEKCLKNSRSLNFLLLWIITFTWLVFSIINLAASAIVSSQGESCKSRGIEIWEGNETKMRLFSGWFMCDCFSFYQKFSWIFRNFSSSRLFSYVN